MSGDSRAERSEAYRDHRTQLVLSKFLSGEFERLEPVFDLKHGYTYPTIEALVGTGSQVEAFLDDLYEIGILKREVFDKTILCPKCNSGGISIRYCCPYCKSFNVKKGSLIEHIQCGYIDIEDRFNQKGRLMCPRCHNELTKPDINYRKAGVWCACNECGKNFDIPVPSHFCRTCKNIFMFEDAIYRDVYSYYLNQEVMNEVGINYILVAPIKELFQSRGFVVKSPGFLKGKSGASHMFDIAASKDIGAQNLIVIDLATSDSNTVSEQSIVAMFAKVYDVAPEKACLIAIPRMSDNGRKLADLYKIRLIEARNQKEVLKALEAICPISIRTQPDSKLPQAQSPV